ncbi:MULTISPECIES: DUF1816 domain-containing protein [Trichocoleus]|uniref:DUF1816 domain-containing protein n=1 Tax=Trichocoleus TaxID=450526 RepID=UPI001688B21B|nr:DUF1816 domain-containing protein [Trichocoleus sp. FACHB-262]MBD2120501.1 DUF1816 domain-containing protein [Trichocoleus sp. FACHB-262]
MFGFFVFFVFCVVLFLLLSRKQVQKDSAWWVEIVTSQPKGTYYFGPFSNVEEANHAQSGYVEDLEGEGSKVIAVQVKWCQPKELTIVEEEQLTYS